MGRRGWKKAAVFYACLFALSGTECPLCIHPSLDGWQATKNVLAVIQKYLTNVVRSVSCYLIGTKHASQKLMEQWETYVYLHIYCGWVFAHWPVCVCFCMLTCFRSNQIYLPRESTTLDNEVSTSIAYILVRWNRNKNMKQTRDK